MKYISEIKIVMINVWNLVIIKIQKINSSLLNLIEMWMLPDEDFLKLYVSYTDLFMLTLIWNVALFGMFIAGAFLVFLVYKIYRIKLKQKQQERTSLLTYDQSARQSQQSAVNYSQLKHQNVAMQTYPNTKSFKLVNFLTSLTFYMILIDVALIVLTLFAFGFLGTSTGNDIMSVILIFAIVAIPTIVWKVNTKFHNFKQIKKQVIFTAFMLAAWLAISIVGVIFLKGVCICAFNDKYGVSMEQDFYLSTQFTRYQQINKVCSDGQLCHFYATLPQETATSVFLNAHTGTNVTNITFKLTDSQGKTFSKNSTSPYAFNNVEQIGKRNVHSVLFEGLTAETLYSVTITDISNSKQSGILNKVIKKSNYKTLPLRSSNKQLRLGMGGDVGMTVNGSKISSYLSSFDPDVLIIGGDIAYDDAMRTCWFSWDNFYWIFEQVDLVLNRTVPLILSIGNHDIGYDALSQIQIKRDSSQIPLFLLYNPQHSSDQNSDNQVPSIEDRKTTHYHIIGNTIHMILDSGYLEKYENQVYFIKYLSQQYNDFYKFANYHNPIYPSCTDPTPDSNDILVISNGTKHWTPVFDQMKFVAAFQHHTHHRKITKKLIDGKVNPNEGVRYIGDGSWGVREGSCSPHRRTNNTQIFEDFDLQDPNHIWQVILTNDQKGRKINYTAINMQGQKVYSLVENLPAL